MLGYHGLSVRAGTTGAGFMRAPTAHGIPACASSAKRRIAIGLCPCDKLLRRFLNESVSVMI
jgi:hypothetical protein